MESKSSICSFNETKQNKYLFKVINDFLPFVSGSLGNRKKTFRQTHCSDKKQFISLANTHSNTPSLSLSLSPSSTGGPRYSQGLHSCKFPRIPKLRITREHC